MMEAVGIGRLGASASLPGDPGDERNWSFTGWFDTTESQALFDFQQHDWSQTTAWMADAQGRRRRPLRALGPVIRPLMRLALSILRRVEHRGQYADPWTLIGKKYGPVIQLLAKSARTRALVPLVPAVQLAHIDRQNVGHLVDVE
jgi:hypothetical protein